MHQWQCALAFTDLTYFRSPAEQWWVVASLVVGGVLLMAALFLRSSPRPTPTCPRCSFDMRGAMSLRCPECGTTAGSVGALMRRSHLSFLAVGLVVMTACPLGLALRWSHGRNWSPPLPDWHCAETIDLGDGTSAQVWRHRLPDELFGGSKVHLEQAIHLPNGARAELWRRYPADEEFDSWKPNEIVLVSADGKRRSLSGDFLVMSLGVEREDLREPPDTFTRCLDVTNDGGPDLLVVDYLDGAHHWVKLGIFECTPDGSFGEYFDRSSRRWPSEPEPAENSGRVNHLGSGWVMHEDGTPLYAIPEIFHSLVFYARLPQPEVLHEIRDGQLVPSPRHMRKPPLEPAALEALIHTHRAADWNPAGVVHGLPWGPWNEAFDNLAGDVLGLIYSGNAKQAWTLIRQSCPIDQPPFDRMYAMLLSLVADNALLHELQPDAWSGPEGPPPSIKLLPLDQAR